MTHDVYDLSRHIEAFANALQAEEIHDNNDNQASPSSPTLSPRVRKVSALSDFAPVNLKVRRHVSTKYQVCLVANFKCSEGKRWTKEIVEDMIGYFCSCAGRFWYFS